MSELVNTHNHKPLVIEDCLLSLYIYQDNHHCYNLYLLYSSLAGGVIFDDFNNDGHVDLIIGNEGTNNAFNSSLNHPVQIHFDDFDQNGSVDPILSYYIQGKSYPLATRDERS